MKYVDFYDIAAYASEHWRGKFTPKEIACHAYNLYAAFEWSKANKKTASIIKSLCENLEEDVVNMPNNEDVKIWIKHIQEELNGAEM